MRWQSSSRKEQKFRNSSLFLEAFVAQRLSLPFPSPCSIIRHSVNSDSPQYRTANRNRTVWTAALRYQVHWAKLPAAAALSIHTSPAAFGQLLLPQCHPTTLHLSHSNLFAEWTGAGNCVNWLPIVMTGPLQLQLGLKTWNKQGGLTSFVKRSWLLLGHHFKL